MTLVNREYTFSLSFSLLSPVCPFVLKMQCNHILHKNDIFKIIIHEQDRFQETTENIIRNLQNVHQLLFASLHMMHLIYVCNIVMPLPIHLILTKMPKYLFKAIKSTD